MSDKNSSQSESSDPIAVNRLRTSRTFGVVAATAISRSNLSLDEIGKKIGKDAKYIRRCMSRLIDGKAISLRDFSDILAATECETNIVMQHSGYSVATETQDGR